MAALICVGVMSSAQAEDKREFYAQCTFGAMKVSKAFEPKDREFCIAMALAWDCGTKLLPLYKQDVQTISDKKHHPFAVKAEKELEQANAAANAAVSHAPCRGAATKMRQFIDEPPNSK
jgi:hypothetical protein